MTSNDRGSILGSRLTKIPLVYAVNSQRVVVGHEKTGIETPRPHDFHCFLASLEISCIKLGVSPSSSGIRES